MSEELDELDAELRGLFMENKLDDMYELLDKQPDTDVQAICENSWSIINKYYETERFELLFQHIKFVAYTCCLVEYSYRMKLIEAEIFESRIVVYNDIYERIQQLRQDTDGK